MVSFALEIGSILIRVANNDVSARMFAGAIRTILTVIIAAAFLPALLQRLNETSPSGQYDGASSIGRSRGADRSSGIGNCDLAGRRHFGCENSDSRESCRSTYGRRDERRGH